MPPKIQMGAFDIETNEYITPTNATKGRAYKCIDCEKKVVLRKGEIRVAHFAHHSQTNTCSYYDRPNEAQIHKDAKILMQKILNEKKQIRFGWFCNWCGSTPYAWEDISMVTYKDGDEAILEYRDPNNKWVADVALVNNNSVRYIFEIKNTHATTTLRPEPWYEIDAQTLITTYNTLLKEAIEENTDFSLYGIDIDCIRKNTVRYCYGSFCYKEFWTANIPGFNQNENSCILCNVTIDRGISDGCTGKFQNGEVRICQPCLDDDIYKKRIRHLFAGKQCMCNECIEIEKVLKVNPNKYKSTDNQSNMCLISDD